jgi:hypothetical protein
LYKKIEKLQNACIIRSMYETQQLFFRFRFLNPEPGGNVSTTEITFAYYPNTCGPLTQKVGTYSTILPDKARTYFQIIAKEKSEFNPGSTRVEIIPLNSGLAAESNPIVVYPGIPRLNRSQPRRTNRLLTGQGFRMTHSRLR